MVVAGLLEPIVVFWTGWGVHFVVLLSFAVQVTLVLLSDIRRTKDWPWLKVIIWSAYMLADTTAIYALGHMSVLFQWSSPDEHRGQLMALWAPLLLVHLGGQDNISAYAIEDNRLWLRHLQAFVLQVAAAGYVLYVSSILSHPMSANKVSWAAILMFVVGVLKYGERIWALKRANSCASSSQSARSYDKQDSSDESDYLVRAKNSQNKELIVAYSLLDVPKQMFEGPTTYVQISNTVGNNKIYGENYMFRVVEMQLWMMYDLLYTKAAVVHTWYGLCSRVLISLPSTVAALALFRSSPMSHNDKVAAAGGYKRSVDVQVTYVLLVGAVVLETMSVLRAIFSNWTALLLYGRGWNTIGNMVFSVVAIVTGAIDRFVYWGGSVPRNCLFKPRQWRQQQDSKYSRGSSSKMAKTIAVEEEWRVRDYSWLPLGRMRQHSIFQLASHSDYSTGSKMAKRMGVDDWWDANVYSWSTDVPERVIAEVLILVSSTTTGDITKSPPGLNAVRRYMNIYEEEPATCIWTMMEELKLEERILVWHIATHVYTEWCRRLDTGRSSYIYLVEATVAVANYMFFLLAARPYMLPYPVSRQAYVQLCSDAVTRFRSYCCNRSTLLEAILNQKEALIEGTPLQLQLQPDEDQGIVGRQANGGGETSAAAAQPQPPQPSMNSILDRGCQLAAKLIHITANKDTMITEQAQIFSNFDAGEVILDMLLEVWVEILCYTAYWCNEKSHAKHLTDGGDIMNAITLLMIYMKNDLIRKVGSRLI